MLWTKKAQKRLYSFIAVALISLWLPSSVFSEIGFRSDLTLVSRYIWRGFDTIPDDGPAIQPSVTFDIGKSGIWLNLWSAIALADTDFVELDLIVGYDRNLPGDFTFSAGLGYFTFPSMSGYPDENSTTPEIYAGIALNSFPLSPSITLYYDFNLGDGFYTTLSLSRDLRLGTQSLRSSVLVGYTRQYQEIGVDPGLSDICLGISTDFGFKNIAITPSINYVIVPNDTINDENEFWVGLMVSWSTD